jgi:hypothetical protein
MVKIFSHEGQLFTRNHPTGVALLVALPLARSRMLQSFLPLSSPACSGTNGISRHPPSVKHSPKRRALDRLTLDEGYRDLPECAGKESRDVARPLALTLPRLNLALVVLGGSLGQEKEALLCGSRIL